MHEDRWGVRHRDVVSSRRYCGVSCVVMWWGIMHGDTAGNYTWGCGGASCTGILRGIMHGDVVGHLSCMGMRVGVMHVGGVSSRGCCGVSCMEVWWGTMHMGCGCVSGN